MRAKIIPHPYHGSFWKKLFDVSLSFIGLIFLSPLFAIIAVFIKLNSKGPAFFKQKRIGAKGEVFQMVKFRIMKQGAERIKWRYLPLNEADGPVFKIRDDPRFTKFGKLLAKTAVDEVPQLINVLKGEMSLVGPRPLPVAEAKRLTPCEQERHLIKPGMTSSWIVKGSHSMKFKKWMELDREYLLQASLASDLVILGKTLLIVPRLVIGQILRI